MDTRSGALVRSLLALLLVAPVTVFTPAHAAETDAGGEPRAEAQGAEEILASPPGRLDDPSPFDLERSPIRGPRRGEGGAQSPWGWQLAAFLGALAAAVAILRGVGPRRDAALPSQSVALLGALPLGGQHGLRVVRFGRRTLLVGISPNGCHLLAETDDPLGGDADGTSGPVTAGTVASPGPEHAPATPLLPTPTAPPAPVAAVPPASRGAA